MSQQGKNMKKKQKRRLRKIFFRTILITLLALGIGAGVIAVLYNKLIYNGTGGLLPEKDPDPINKTVAVFGVDEDGYRTDVIFAVNFNSENDRIRIISIPRDTKVEWAPEMREKMEEIKGYSISVSKINEMTGYVGIDHITDFTIPEIEKITGLSIDNYVIVTIDAFKQIVDAIGGVEVEVPALKGDGLHYDDNSQDLHIHLQPGIQTLDGEAAEGLVRFRKGYVEGDVGRIRTQQLFLEGFTKKVTSPQIITKLPAVIKAVIQTVTTDISLNEAMSYLPYVKRADASKLKADIIPGEARYEGGKSYYIPNEEEMPAFINDILYGATEEELIETVDEVVINKEVAIEVLNSTSTSGLAGRERDRLTNEGYSIRQIGNYTPSILDKTRIYARNPKNAKQFLSYYSNAEIVQSDDIPYDIQIVLGNDSI